MKQLKLGLMLRSCIILLYFLPLSSAAVINWNDNSGHVEINKLQYIVDTELEYSADTILSSTKKWMLNNEKTSASFGFTKAAVWLKFSVKNNSNNQEQTWFHLDYTLLDSLEVYEYSPASTEAPKLVKVMGELAPVEQREVDYRQSVIELEFDKGELKHFLLKAKTSGSLKLPLNLWNKEVFLTHAESSTFVNGVVFGALLILGFFAFISSIFLKERYLFYYALFLTSVGAFLFAYMGYSNHYIFQEYRWLNDIIVPISILLAVLCALLFTGAYVELEENSAINSIIFKSIRCLVFLAVVLIIICLFAPYSIGIRVAAFYVGIVITPGIVLTVRLYAQEAGRGYNKFYALSWIPVFLGGICLCLNLWNVIPSNFIIDYSLMIGLSMQFVILMYGASYRYYQETRAHLETHFEKVKLEEMSIKDSLTKLYNRRFVDSKIKEELHRASRLNQKIGFVLIDIDHFKTINDTFGHDVGDVCLRKIAGLMQSTFRRELDIVSRYGGEEFLVMLPYIEKEALIELVDNFRKESEKIIFFPEQGNRKITISAGATLYEGGRPVNERVVFKIIDDALYSAKKSGRNKVVFSQLSDHYLEEDSINEAETIQVKSEKI